jgi:hypothetical protein
MKSITMAKSMGKKGTIGGPNSHMSGRGIEDRWRIVTVGSASQINGRDELRGEKEELNNSLVPIPQLV